jgi:DNA polymerase III epsilon subunit-like protein
MADLDLEQLAARLEQSGDYRILRRVPVLMRYADDDPATIKRLGLIVDIETTGLDPAKDKIIELACLPFHFSSDGEAQLRAASNRPWPARMPAFSSIRIGFVQPNSTIEAAIWSTCASLCVRGFRS